MSYYPPPQGPPPGQQYQYGYPPQGQQQFQGQPQFYPPQGPPPPQFNQQQYGQNQAQPPYQQPFQQQPFQQQPHQQPFQQPYQQPFAAQPTPPSPGYDPHAHIQGDASADADALRKAMKGFGTDEKVLIGILSQADPLRMKLINQAFTQRNKGRDLVRDIESETSGYLEEGLVALARGPLMHDVVSLRKALKGLGTDEQVLNDVLCARSNADMRAIKAAFEAMYKTSLQAALRSDLSAKTETLFDMIVAANRAEESAPIMPQDLERDINELHRAMGGRMGTDEIMVCGILTSRSDGQLRAIAQAFQQKFSTTLEKSIDSEFSGHMKQALLLIVKRGTDRAMCDAEQLEATMAGAGTKDSLLVNRVVRCHWNKAHRDQVRRAYQHRFKKDLISRIKGETSGKYEDLMVACMS